MRAQGATRRARGRSERETPPATHHAAPALPPAKPPAAHPPAAAAKVEPPKPAAATKDKAAEQPIVCDAPAEWARGELLSASLLAQVS